MADAKARTPQKPKQKLGNYDSAFVNSVRERWYDLLDSSGYDNGVNGEVTLKFRLLTNGSVSNFEVVKTTVNTQMTALCKQAILDIAPFPHWPSSMLAEIKKNYREIRFTFYFDEPHGPRPLAAHP